MKVLIQTSRGMLERECSTYDVAEDGTLDLIDSEGYVYMTFHKDFWQSAEIIEPTELPETKQD
jgi:hypothetical protein